MGDDGCDVARTRVKVGCLSRDREHGILGANHRRIERECEDDGRHATKHFVSS
jgi:hypothetical protein